ncbi:hypothetical protein Tco_0899286 [Tanacetum coccineum]
MVAFFAKPAESEGFEQIVDFLNAHTIKYASTVNPTIYTSCIEQFWATVKAKTVNGEVQLQALVDGKKIIITESIVRRDLQLEHVEDVDCLPNATIFEQLTLMGAKTTAWNEFSSIMASAIICLATNHKFNFSKYIFESMVKNLDNVGNFLMYPRFIQVFLDKQLEGMSNHKRIYITPSHTKKIFKNMRRVGKGFSGRVTPLFPTITVQAQQEQGEGLTMPTDPQHIPTITQPSTSQPKKTQKPRKPKKNTEVPQPSGSTKHVADEAINEEMDDSLVRAATTASSLEAEQDSGNIIKTRSKATPNEAGFQGTTSGGGPRCQDTMGDTIAQTRFENMSKTSNDSLIAGVNTPRSDEDRLKLNELMEFCTKLQQRVFDLENTKTAQAQEITSLKLRVKKLEKKGGSRTHKLKRLYKVGRSARVVSSNEAREDMAEKEINVAEKEVSTADPITTAGEVVTTASVEISIASPTETIIADDLTLAQTLIEIRSAKPKVKGVMIGEQSESTTRTRKVDEVRAEGSKTVAEGSSKRAGEELEQESSKKQKLEEDKESEELKKCLEIILDDGDDVTIDATLLSIKSLSIVD